MTLESTSALPAGDSAGSSRVRGAASGQARDRWLKRIGEHQLRVRAWLDGHRQPGASFIGTRRSEGLRLASQAHLLAAEGLFVGAACEPSALAILTALGTPRLPRVIAGAADDGELARLIERAATHQMRALAWVRRARDPEAQMAMTMRRRDMLLRAIEHIANSQRLLRRAQERAPDDGRETLESHLAQLAAAATSVERMVYEIDEAQQG